MIQGTVRFKQLYNDQNIFSMGGHGRYGGGTAFARSPTYDCKFDSVAESLYRIHDKINQTKIRKNQRICDRRQ